MLIPKHLPSWGQNEPALSPPLGLLEWLVLNISPELVATNGCQGETLVKRKALADGDPEILGEALNQLRAGNEGASGSFLRGHLIPTHFLRPARSFSW